MNSMFTGMASVIAAAIGFLLGVSLQRVTPGSTWIYDYQALSAGFLAIAAALITVAAMRWTEARQEARHRALMRLNLRSEELRVRRKRAVARDSLTEAAAYLKPTIFPKYPASAAEYHNIWTHVERGQRNLRMVEACLSNINDVFDAEEELLMHRLSRSLVEADTLMTETKPILLLDLPWEGNHLFNVSQILSDWHRQFIADLELATALFQRVDALVDAYRMG